MEKNREKITFYSFVEPFHLFYLGFLSSVGLAFGSTMIINVIRKLIELQWEFEILIYSRITLSIFYLLFLIYTYYLLDMKKGGALRNGFILFASLYILAQIYLWI
jgi:hypothetical protein